MQALPAAQDPHVPLWQTWFVPHSIPLALFPASVHTGAPVPQLIVPVLQGFVGWQAVPAVHAIHVPVLQTWFVPQTVPLVLLAISAHIEVPDAHEVAPVLQGFVG